MIYYWLLGFFCSICIGPSCFVLSLCSAQEFLEPELGVLNEEASVSKHFAAVRQILIGSGDETHLARMVCVPTFDPEWVVTVRMVRPDAWEIELKVAGKQISAVTNPETVKARSSTCPLDGKTAILVFRLWRRMLNRVQYGAEDCDPDIDGVEYCFSSSPDGKPTRSGRLWAEAEKLHGEGNAARLVSIGETMRELADTTEHARPTLLMSLRNQCNQLEKLLDASEHKVRDRRKD